MKTLHACGMAAALLAAAAARAADWPAYRHDAQRSGVAGEALSFPLRLAWEYRCAQPPSPAWPDTYRLLNRVDFDYAPQPVAAGGAVCFGSSADDTVRALDARTGREMWHFVAGGPVRFAPQIEGGKVYFASDDGWVYCLNAGTGALAWKFCAAPADERMVGNHRMISRWPVRTGVLVADGVVYAAAGMWSAEGIFVHALDVETGKARWCTDARGGTPQGALLSAGDVLLVPNGNSGPTPLDRRTGRAVPWRGGGQPGAGGTWATIDGSSLYSFATHRSGVLLIQSYAVSNGLAGKAWDARVVPQLSIEAPWSAGKIHDKGKVSAIVHRGRPYARAAYGIAMSGPALLLGHDGAVTAERADAPQGTSVLWRAQVDGEAREFAVADGRLYVGTSRGVIYCFEAGTAGGGSQQASVVSRQSSVTSLPSSGASGTLGTGHRSPVTSAILAAGVDRGFALVLGDPEARLSLDLATSTALRVVTVLTDESAAGALRERLLAGTTLYGSRIHVQTVARLDRLPFAQYFANAVVVAGPAPGLSGSELYRVLHPCGGLLVLPGLKPDAAAALVAGAGAPGGEVRQTPDGPRIVRGKLPGALDWDTNPREFTTDQRVKWPLRLLWFGGPSTRQVQNAEQGAPGPAVANGRYAMFGEQTLSMVDAYNGEVLWSRPIPRQWPQIRDVNGLLFPTSEPTRYGKGDLLRGCRLNDDSVYLQLGKAYFRGRSDALIQLDARTGAQKKFYGWYCPPTPVSLKTPHAWPVDVDTNHSGTVSLAATERGLALTLLTRDPAVTPLDAWELFFDLRPPEARYGLYERGAFSVRVVAGQGQGSAPSWSPGTGELFPAIELAGGREAGGTRTVVTLPWPELEKLAGSKPASFGFAATLNACDGKPGEPIARRHLFGDWTADAINNGWADVRLDGDAAEAAPARPPAVVAGASNALKDPVGRATAGRTLNASVTEAAGVHPLTGEPVPKVFGLAPVCGAPHYSGNLISGHFSIYDLAENSGPHPVGGVKTGCTTPQAIALGLLIISEENGHCVCNYPLHTSLAMAPAERQLNEDWTQFYERDVDTLVRQCALNFGAAGDRRDPAGSLWLGFPRGEQLWTPEDFPNADHPLPYPQGMRDAQTGLWYRRPLRPSVWVPLTVEAAEGLGVYRFSTDRMAIRGTDRPWIYGSGYRGIQRATLRLSLFKPLFSSVAPAPPAVDGRLDEATWQERTAPTNSVPPLLPFTETQVLFRHDNRNLYVGVHRPPMVFRPPRAVRTEGTAHGAFKSEPRAWGSGLSKPDELSPRDNWWRLILSDPAGSRAVYLSVTADGVRADALGDSTTNALNRGWNAPWESAAVADTNGLTVEMAIPWTTLESAGLSRDQLAANFMMYDPGIGAEALTYLGIGGYDHCSNFTPLGMGRPAAPAPRSFTVRLHFAEPDEGARPGQRVFDVKLQGQTVLTGFDIVKEAGAPLTAVVKEFTGVRAADALTLEFTPALTPPTPATAPILCGLEVRDETYPPPRIGSAR